jgi:exopolysaccharide production protein ExoQ
MTNIAVTAHSDETTSSRLPWFAVLFLTAVFLIDHQWNMPQAIGDRVSMSSANYAAAAHEASPLREIALFLLGSVSFLSMWRAKGRRRVRRSGALAWLMIMSVIWAVMSLTWSDDPATSARRLVVLGMLCLGAFAVGQRLSLRDIVAWIFVSTLFYVSLGVTAEIVLGTFRPLSDGYRFAGTLHPNYQSVNCALLLFASVFQWLGAKRWRWFFALLACGALACLILTRSRTSLGATLFATLIYWFLTSRASRRGLILSLGLIAVTIGTILSEFALPMVQGVVTIGRIDAENATLSGRTFLWQQSLSFLAERPLLGYGYDAFWTPRHLLDFAAQQGWNVPNVHSSYIDVCLGLGMVGGVLFILMSMAGIGRAVSAQNTTRDASYSFMCVVLAYIAIHGITESLLFHGNQVTFVWIVISTQLAFFHQPSSPIATNRNNVDAHGRSVEIDHRGRLARWRHG